MRIDRAVGSARRARDIGAGAHPREIAALGVPAARDVVGDLDVHDVQQAVAVDIAAAQGEIPGMNCAAIEAGVRRIHVRRIERRARAASERKELAASIRTELLDAEAQINEVYCRANASLVKYSKAGKFRVISDEEIPRFHPDFSVRKFVETLGIDKEVFE